MSTSTRKEGRQTDTLTKTLEIMTDAKQDDTDQGFRDKVKETFNRIAEETPDPDAKGETPRYSPDDNK